MAQTAAELGISDSCLRSWIARAAIDARESPGLSSDDGRELAELQRRKWVLETENEILKRVVAYFAGRRPRARVRVSSRKAGTH